MLMEILENAKRSKDKLIITAKSMNPGIVVVLDFDKEWVKVTHFENQPNNWFLLPVTEITKVQPYIG